MEMQANLERLKAEQEAAAQPEGKKPSGEGTEA